MMDHGWRSRYDYDGISNTEKYFGRKLHTQDNAWGIAKVLYVLLAILLVYCWCKGDFSLSAVANFIQYTRF